uniref:Uncharacterized protein n=1 Tax=Hyaloperonospora arabidopsidis (strain Emoy2) TaxID=559515 RepID=M4BQ95_HYAAE
MVWWSEFPKRCGETPDRSLCRTADLRRGTLMPRMDLLSLCVPVGWRVAFLGRLGENADVDLDRGQPGEPRVDMLHSVGQ